MACKRSGVRIPLPPPVISHSERNNCVPVPVGQCGSKRPEKLCSVHNFSERSPAMSKRTKPPSYRRHKPSGQAIVTLAGRTYYLGRYRSQASKRKYDLLIAEWLTSGRTSPYVCPEQDISVGQLSLGYWEFAQRYYCKDGRPTGEVSTTKSALRFLNDLYAQSTAAEFGPLALKTVRNNMIRHGLCRNVIN